VKIESNYLLLCKDQFEPVRVDGLVSTQEQEDRSLFALRVMEKCKIPIDNASKSVFQK